MPKILISCLKEDLDTIKILEKGLLNKGFSITYTPDLYIPGANINKAIIEAMTNTDIVLIYASSNTFTNDYRISFVHKYQMEMMHLNNNMGSSNFTKHLIVSDKPFTPRDYFINIIPIVMDPNTYNTVDSVIEKIIEKVKERQAELALAENKRIEIEASKKEKVERIKRNASEFIDPAMKMLKGRERKNFYLGIVYAFIGLLAIALGVYFSFKGGKSIDLSLSANWISLTLILLKYSMVIVLLIAGSKFSFQFSSAHLNESHRNADRIHAIQFGEFFLNVYGDSVSRKEVIEIFQDWNIESKSSFSHLDSDKFDPNLIQIIIKVIETLDIKKK